MPSRRRTEPRGGVSAPVWRDHGAPDATRHSAAAPLIADRREIFDREAVWAELLAGDEPEASVAARRQAAVGPLRAAIEAGRARIQAKFDTEIRSGARVARSIAAMTDDVLEVVHHFVAGRLFFIASPTRGEKLAMIAVGGYGRGEMAPFSDVDLLFLTPYRRTAWSESVVEATLYLLWDLKMKVGHATRTIMECLRLASEDMTIRTALLEKRLLAGDRDVFDALSAKLWTELFDRTGPEFLEAKLAERDRRHERHGGSRYMLEPNVKESKGGLRDLQALYWIAKYLYRADTPEQLVTMGVFTAAEVTRFRTAEQHLWTVRCGLHYLAGRAQEKLSFDHQIELADRFQYRDTAAARPVERMMKRYFAAAKSVGDLTRIFCASLEAQHRKTPPLIGAVNRFFAASDAAGPIPGAEDWLERRDGRLALSDPGALSRDPIKILALFDIAVRLDILIHPEALKELSRRRRAADDLLAENAAAGPLFVDLIAGSRDPGRALIRMSETGVIDRLLPEFGRITGLMQFNMYHHYTVEAHTILAVQILHRIRSGQLAEDNPTATKVAQSIDDLRVLTAALLLHDIGKGLGEDHSIAGERIAREVCPMLGMTPSETDNVAWLVRHHLAMSDVAQKRDISDPATLRSFAGLVRSPERLKMLYVLTVCDIRAVGPGVWNGWKAQLLRTVFHETRAILTDAQDSPTRTERIEAAQTALKIKLGGLRSDPWSPERVDQHIERFFPAYWLGLDAPIHAMHAEMTTAADGPLAMRVRQAPERDATVIAFYTNDHPGLFARMTGAFAIAGASVVDARAYTTRDGSAVNTFWVQTADGEPYDDLSRLDRLQTHVERTLKGEVIPREALRERRPRPARERSFTVPPQVAIDNHASDTFTLVEVDGRDRVGLLHELARALSAESVNIFSAIIATYGEQAVDVFYVRDLFGMKITSDAKKARIERALLAVLARDPDHDPDQDTPPGGGAP